MILFAVLLVVWGSKLAVEQRAREKPLRDSLAYTEALLHNRERQSVSLLRSYRSAAYVVDSLERRVQQAEGLLSYLQQDSLCRVR